MTHPQHVLDILRFITKALKVINQNGNSDGLDPKVVIDHLDFYSGKPGAGETFIHPFSLSQMRQLISETQSCDNEYTSILPIDDQLDNCGQARDLWEVFHTYLDTLDESRWAFFYPNEDNLLFRLMKATPSKVEIFMDTFDPMVPHMNCFLVNELPFQEMIPSSKELKVILWIIGCRLRDEKYQHHKIVPVTIISAAGYLLRIVQGYINQQQLFVRMTPIFDFKSGEKAMQTEFYQTLCWFVGDPVGNTT
ncbi:hypothetical protein F5B19DRAFT_259223 [Rostrohypoxylon terebratum]|nr:hypothetical protein F5B19DRAFT_259223 [Rostrohypoxylon terebratum]